MNRSKSFWLISGAVFVILLALGLQKTIPRADDPLEIHTMDLEQVLSNAHSDDEYSRDGYYRARYYYDNEDYQLFGDETAKLIECFYEGLPDDFVYATDGTDFSRARPSNAGKFRKNFV